MKTIMFEAATRRGSFRLLGAAALAGVIATPATSGAAKSGKKTKDRCRRQRGQCLAFVAEFCQPKAEPQSCQEALAPCCDHFARCNAGQGIECLFEKVSVG